MGVAGSISPPGGAPKPDPERVATLRYTLVDEPETCAAFGEAARATLASLNDRALAEARNGDLGACSLLLDHVRDRVAGLDPARLVPRRGLAGLFDSRNKRLKAFRAGYAAAASAVTQSAADLGERAAVLARKDTALESLWSETRDAIAELDAHIAAARGWLVNQARPPVAEAVEPVETVAEAAGPEPVEAVHAPVESAIEAGTDLAPVDHPVEPDGEPKVDVAADGPAPILSETAEPSETAIQTADAEIAAATGAEPGNELLSDPGPEPMQAPAPVVSLPHPLETRLATFEALRAIAIGRLPLIRAAQNADFRTPAALKQVCDGVEAWRADWQDALGLAGKRPRKVAPDRVRLADATSALTDQIDVASRELSAAQGRRAELEARTAPPKTVSVALAA